MRRRSKLAACTLAPRRVDGGAAHPGAAAARGRGRRASPITSTSTGAALPDIEPFIRFELSTIGKIYDAQGTVLVELAREYRRVVSYDEMPSILRDAILAAEDKNFFAHSGVEYRALPRVIYKAATSSLRGLVERRRDSGLRFPQGGSTLTQQLVRGYFLRDRSEPRERRARSSTTTWSRGSLAAGRRASRPRTSSLRKLEEMRLALWLEEEMSRRFGSRERAKREIFARYGQLQLPGQRPLRLRRRLRVLLRQAALELHAGGRRNRPRCSPGSPRRRGTTSRCPATRGRCAAATRSWR